MGVFLSCQKTNEEKADALIDGYIRNSISKSETYEPIETEIDSAFSPFDSPEFYDKTCQIIRLGEDVENLLNRIEKARMTMALGVLSFSASGIEKCLEAKKEMTSIIEEYNRDSVRFESMLSDLQEELSKEPEFIGFKARHKYKVKDENNRRVFGEYKFVFDPQIKSITDVYDMNEEEYRKVREMYDAMMGKE